MVRSMINGQAEKMVKVTFRCFEVELSDYFIQLERAKVAKRRRYTLSVWIRDTLNKSCNANFFDTPQHRQNEIDQTIDFVKGLAEAHESKGGRGGKKQVAK